MNWVILFCLGFTALHNLKKTAYYTELLFWEPKSNFILVSSTSGLFIYMTYMSACTLIQLLESISSGHQANIFSAKFLPCTSDAKVNRCKISNRFEYLKFVDFLNLIQICDEKIPLNCTRPKFIAQAISQSQILTCHISNLQA